MTIQKYTLGNLGANWEGYGIKYFQSLDERAARTNGEKESHEMEHQKTDGHMNSDI